MKLRISILILFSAVYYNISFGQSTPQFIGDSVKYEGKMYSFSWHDGYQRGIQDGRSNNYRIFELEGKNYLREYNYNQTNNRTEVTDEWKNGYIKGYALGFTSYQTSVASSYNHIDSVMYEGKLVSRKWYNNNVNYETAMMPGFSYNFILPNAEDSLGIFQGFGIEYLFYAKVTQNDRPGPSHVRFYGRLNLLKSSKNDINDAFAYTLGLDLSLEKNPKRSFLVPYFGIEAGGISQKQLGNTLQFTPTFGIHLLSKKNLFASVQGGYMYPVGNFDMLRGYTAQASINVALW